MTESGLRTAVVFEDEPDRRSAVSRLLTLAGCSLVVESPSLSRLRTLVEWTTPDLVVLDLALAGMHGLDVVRDLHFASARTAIIVMSPFTSLRVAALAAGARALVGVDDLRELDAVLCGLRLPPPRRQEPTTPAAGRPHDATTLRIAQGGGRQR